jgi:S-formylglutathione hydrolase
MIASLLANIGTRETAQNLGLETRLSLLCAKVIGGSVIMTRIWPFTHLQPVTTHPQDDHGSGRQSTSNVNIRGRGLLSLLLYVFGALAFSSPLVSQSEVIEITVHSSGLEHNLLGDSADQKVAVYVPVAPRTDSEQRFATIYFLHGFDDTPALGVAQILQKLMDKLIAEHAIQPMIVVVPNGLNRYLGSFYTNSEVTGNWEDYIFRDVVQYVDSHFRTIPSAEARGISGHSMGGYGALMLAFRHPDVFSSVFAMSPCCEALDNDFGPSNQLWTRISTTKQDDLPRIVNQDFLLAVFIAMDAAFAPDPANGPLLGDPPFRWDSKQLVPDPISLSKFGAHLLNSAIPRLLPSIAKLKGIYIDYGEEDEFSHIGPGVRAMSAQLAISGIPHTVEAYEGNHGDRARDRIEDRVLPWFSQQLRH